MSARASHQTGREELARAINRFARALCAGDDAGDRTLRAPMHDAAQFAMNAAKDVADDADARALAYRTLIRGMLRGNDPGGNLGDGTARTTGRAPQPARAASGPQAAAIAARPPRAADVSRTLHAFARLEPVERAALLLVALERFSYAEAAAALDLEGGEFVAALARGREAFAARLAAGAQGRPRLRLVE